MNTKKADSLETSMPIDSEENTPPRCGSEVVEDYLKQHDIQYDLLPLDHPYSSFHDVMKTLDLPKEQFVRTVMLQEQKELFMAILPAHHILDFAGLSFTFQKQFYPCPKEDLESIFLGCGDGIFPPFPDLYGIKGFLEETILDQEHIYLESGNKKCLLRLHRDEFKKIHAQTWQGQFSEDFQVLQNQRSSSGVEADIAQVVQRFTPKRMQSRIEETYELPVMPVIANELLKLRVDPNADAISLGQLVQKDPSLAAQLISWANSPYYGYPTKITSVGDAIIKVLGFDLVMNVSLGIAIGNVMKVPAQGPIGLREFWRHSLYCAHLVDKLILKIPYEFRPYRGLAFLCGLLHNLGVLLLGQLFPPQYFLLNRFIQFNPHLCMTSLEHYVLGLSHQQMGAWLMEAWNMPEEIKEACAHHHDSDFYPTASIYVQLVYVANVLLRRKDIGDSPLTHIEDEKFTCLHLKKEEAEAVLEETMLTHESLDNLVDLLTKTAS